MQKCKLCLKEKTLRKSHIIPEFMYTGIYDKNPKRYYEIEDYEGDLKSRIEQKGKREPLLCSECESKISKYEKYADENLYGKNKRAKAQLVNKIATQDGKIFIDEFINFDFKKMKLFLDSLIWRILISETFPTPDYGQEVNEKLRNSIFNETPLQENEFPCLIQPILTKPGKILSGFMLSPIERDFEGHKMLSILIDGLLYNFFFSDKLPDYGLNPFLQKNGELKLFGTLIFNLPDLYEIIKVRMAHLIERLERK